MRSIANSLFIFVFTFSISSLGIGLYLSSLLSSYLGETGRKLNIRLNEHKRDAKNKTGNMSGLSQHITKYKHTADWENVKIIHKETNFCQKKIQRSFGYKRKFGECHE